VRELSLHIMDIIENSMGAGASLVTLSINEDRRQNWLYVRISDNGRGIPEDLVQKVMDPFFTTRTTRRVGLGLSLFRETCKRCDGEFFLSSKEGVGTEVRASFRMRHIDLPPLGDMAKSLVALIVGNPEVDIEYIHEVNGQMFQLDTRRVKEELEGLPIVHPEVIRYLGDTIRESLSDMKAGSFHLPPATQESA
jgi:hypothetical protein